MERKKFRNGLAALGLATTLSLGMPRQISAQEVVASSGLDRDCPGDQLRVTFWAIGLQPTQQENERLIAYLEPIGRPFTGTRQEIEDRRDGTVNITLTAAENVHSFFRIRRLLFINPGRPNQQIRVNEEVRRFVARCDPNED
jgi:hypothetical protein